MRCLHRGIQTPGATTPILACFLVVASFGGVNADPIGFVPTQTTTESPPRTMPAAVPPSTLRSTADLDGVYLWIGPIGAASWIGSQWDSIFGADVSVVRVREHEPLGVVGASFGAMRFTQTDSGRLWLDAVVATPVAGHMIGASAGPLVELSDLEHPRVGGSIGVWGFVGVTPYARVGVVDGLGGLGGFAEIGVHIALPVIRR